MAKARALPEKNSGVWVAPSLATTSTDSDKILLPCAFVMTKNLKRCPLLCGIPQFHCGLVRAPRMHELPWSPQKTREIITILLVLSRLLLRVRKGGGAAIGAVALRFNPAQACFHVKRHEGAKKRRFRMHGQSKNYSPCSFAKNCDARALRSSNRRRAASDPPTLPR